MTPHRKQRDEGASGSLWLVFAGNTSCILFLAMDKAAAADRNIIEYSSVRATSKFIVLRRSEIIGWSGFNCSFSRKT